MNDLKRELKIKELYEKGVTQKEICKECKCSTNTIGKILDKYNIPRRIQRKPNKDFSKFYDLSLPETQYWIGYICADGNIEYSTDHRIYKVSLFSKEEEPIKKFVKYFGTDTVSIHRRKSGIIEAYINSKELATYFIEKLNIVPNKSNILDPNIEYTTNFILGYFDGDGCIVNSSDSRKRHECNITCGSRIFLEKIKEKLDAQGIYSIIYQHTDCDAYKIRIDRKEDSEKFYRWLYKEKSVCLSRKLNNFVALYGNIDENNRVNCGNKKEDPQPSQPLTKLEGSTTND